MPRPLSTAFASAPFLGLCFCLLSVAVMHQPRQMCVCLSQKVGVLGGGGLVCIVVWDDSAANKLCAIESIKVSVNCKRRFITTTNCKNTRKNNKQNFAPPLFYLHTYIHICVLYACMCVCVCLFLCFA